jgi:hypothetical protein
MNISRFAISGLVACCATIDLSAGPAATDPGDSLQKKSRVMLDGWLGGKLKSSPIHIEPKIVPIDVPIVRQVFPKDDFYGVYMPRWPRAITPPAGLSFETIVVLRNRESVEAILGNDGLRSFLGKTLVGVTDESTARTVVEASLVLVAFCSPNGPYNLQAPLISVIPKGKGIIATAQAEVQEVDRGNIKISIEFDPAGGTTSDAVTIASSIRPGPPPR